MLGQRASLLTFARALGFVSGLHGLWVILMCSSSIPCDCRLVRRRLSVVRCAACFVSYHRATCRPRVALQRAVRQSSISRAARGLLYRPRFSGNIPRFQSRNRRCNRATHSRTWSSLSATASRQHIRRCAHHGLRERHARELSLLLPIGRARHSLVCLLCSMLLFELRRPQAHRITAPCCLASPA